MHKAFTLAALSSVCACSCPGPGVCMPGMTAPPSTAFAIDGAPVTVEVILAVMCGDRFPDSADVSVLDPSNQPIAADGGTPFADPGGLGAAVNVTFTPPGPGQYHVAARFQPDFGTGQLDVTIAGDLSASPAVATVATAQVAVCDRVEVSPRGQLVCISFDEVSFPGSSLATVAGSCDFIDGVLWVFDGNTVTRYVENADGGFAATHSVELTGSASILATPNSAVFAQVGSLLALSPQDDGGLSVQPLSVSVDSKTIWRDDNEADVFDSTSLCEAPLDGGPELTTDGCPMFPLSSPPPAAFAVDTDGIWASDESAAGNNVVHSLTAQSSAELTLPTGWFIRSTSPTWENGGVVLGADGDAGFVLKSTGGAVVLESYTRAGETVGQVDSHFVVLKGPNGTSRIVAR